MKKNVIKLIKYFVDPMPEDVKPTIPGSQPLTLKDQLAPAVIDVDFDNLKIGDWYFRTLFVSGYPRFVSANWLEPLISFNHTLDIAMYIYPTRSEEVLENLKRKVGEMEATIQSDIKRGHVIEPSVQVALEDALSLQQELAKGSERFFQFALYISIPAKTLDDLNKTTKQVEATLASLLITTKRAVLQQEEGYKTSLPMGQDRLLITRNMDTTSLATTFPFTTSELTANEGILYGINEGNESLIIFDRFTLENANTVVFGKSIAAWETVLIRENNQVRLEKIGSLIEKLIQTHGLTYRDSELEGVQNPPIEVFSYAKNLSGEWTKVSVAARKPFSPKESLYSVTTKSGRSITVTADHSLITLRDGHIKSITGKQIRTSDVLPLARSLPEPNNQPKQLIPKKYISKWPASLPQTLPIDNSLMNLLGLTTSEGYISEEILTIYNADNDVLEAIKSSASAIGARATLRQTPQGVSQGYTIQPNAWAKLFIAMGAGGRSGNKRIPPIIFSLPNNLVSVYLRAYFEGDGTTHEEEVSCCSKSRELISDLAYLLLRFKIIVRIQKKWKRATNTKHRGDNYYQLVISGAQNISDFSKHIGFLTEKKQHKLLKMLGKNANTNVDTIPTLAPTINKLYHMLYHGDDIKAPPNFSPLKRGIFSPSRSQLTDIIMAAENRIHRLKKLRKNIVNLNRLPDVDKLINRGQKRKHLNRLLWQELGQSWRLMKKRAVIPGSINVLRAYKTISGETISLPEIKQIIYETFQETGVSLLKYNKSLWTNIVLEGRRQGDLSYPTLAQAVAFVKKRYRSIQLTIRHAQKILSDLKRLTTSDLFWDPIVKIEKISHQENYVYDLTVDNHVFLAGNGGIFVHNSGSGKSYAIKLEILRSLMFNTEVIVIDPENEYAALTHALGGEYINFRFGAGTKVNPFDLAFLQNSDNESELNQKILSLHGFFRVVMGTLTPSEDALLDRALVLTYKQKGITPDPATQSKEPPLMEDLYKALIGMEDPLSRGLADRIEKFVKGSLVGIFDQQTNVEIRNPLTVFSIRDLEEQLRPTAMYLILDFIWTKIRRDTRRRILVVDEAWYMMKFPDSAQFLNSIAKRARKYYLGVTTITQDVEDFLSIDLGKAIIQNSSMQILLKQSSASIDKVAEVFYLSEGEKHLLLSADIGEGLLFAGPAHAAMRIIASPEEHALATTKPQEVIDNKSKYQPSSIAHPAPPPRPIFTVEQVEDKK